MKLNQQAWDEYVQYRKDMKFRKLKDKTVSRMHKKLMQYTEEEQRAMIDQTLDNQWQGIFPLKVSYANQRQANQSAVDRVRSANPDGAREPINISPHRKTVD